MVVVVAVVAVGLLRGSDVITLGLCAYVINMICHVTRTVRKARLGRARYLLFKFGVQYDCVHQL